MALQELDQKSKNVDVKNKQSPQRNNSDGETHSHDNLVRSQSNNESNGILNHSEIKKDCHESIQEKGDQEERQDGKNAHI